MSIQHAPATEWLPRLKPAHLPPLHPVPELEARGTLLSTYQETKQMLQVPWMGVVAMAFAHYPHFYASLWQGLRPLLRSREFEQACQDLRRHAELNASQLPIHNLEAELRQDGYTGNELTQIRDLIEVFSHGNMPYLLLATFARLLLEGHELSAQRQVEPGSHLSAPEPHVPLVLMEAHHGDSALRHLYEEIRTTLGLPFVNTDYRALARWPSYFSRAWSAARPQILSAAYEPLVADTHAKAVQLALTLPNPGALSSDTLQAAAEQDGALAEIGDVVRLFQYLLPGLITNVALFRAQLLPGGLETSAQTAWGE